MCYQAFQSFRLGIKNPNVLSDPDSCTMLVKAIVSVQFNHFCQVNVCLYVHEVLRKFF